MLDFIIEPKYWMFIQIPNICIPCWNKIVDFDYDLVQDCSNSVANEPDVL